MNLEDVERLLRERLEALGPAPRAELLRVLMLPDYGPVIGEHWANPKTRTFAELPIDAEEDRDLPQMGVVCGKRGTTIGPTEAGGVSGRRNT